MKDLFTADMTPEADYEFPPGWSLEVADGGVVLTGHDGRVTITVQYQDMGRDTRATITYQVGDRQPFVESFHAAKDRDGKPLRVAMWASNQVRDGMARRREF